LLSAIVCEIDHLSLVKTAFSSSAGEELVSNVAEILSNELRDTDVLGLLADEVLVIVTDALPTITDLERLTNRIAKLLSEPVSFGSRSQIVTCSLGVSWVGVKDGDADNLIRDALAAKNKAKLDRGSSVQFFDDSVRSEAFNMLEIERELDTAISSNQLEVHYQAIFDSHTEEPVRYEALVRWFHPAKGLLRPNVFLDVAAKSDLILRLGDFVLTETCMQAMRWSNQTGHEIKVAVNIAEGQFFGDDLAKTVNETIIATGISPSQIELEFAEHLISSQLDYSKRVLQTISETGVSIAIDNFGASSASIGILKNLPMVDTLKLDRQFVVGVDKNETERNLVKAVTAIAKDMGFKVTAEGVETIENAMELKELGVDFLQGFLFHRPKANSEALIESAYLSSNP